MHWKFDHQLVLGPIQWVLIRFKFLPSFLRSISLFTGKHSMEKFSCFYPFFCKLLCWQIAKDMLNSKYLCWAKFAGSLRTNEILHPRNRLILFTCHQKKIDIKVAHHFLQTVVFLKLLYLIICLGIQTLYQCTFSLGWSSWRQEGGVPLSYHYWGCCRRILIHCRHLTNLLLLLLSEETTCQTVAPFRIQFLQFD